jgi:hypothetical protein
MYVRFPLSLRNVEDLLHERGLDVSHPQVGLLATNADKNLIKMPGFRWLNSAGSDVGGNRRTEFQNPTADCFIAHIDPTLGKHFLDVPKAQRKSKIEPDSSLNYGGRKSVACVRYFSHSKAIICRDDYRRVNVTMPFWVSSIKSSRRSVRSASSKSRSSSVTLVSSIA